MLTPYFVKSDVVCSLDREVIGCWCTWMEYQRGGRLYIDSCRWICASMRSSHVKAGAES